MNSFQHKTVWITGASSGIGAELAVALSARGATLVLSARNAEGIEQVRQRCRHPDHVHVLPLDLTHPDTFLERAETAWSLNGGIDCIIHNAGMVVRDLSVSIQPGMDRLVMETNYFGPVLLTKALLPYLLRRQSGHIVAVTSLSGKYGIPRLTAYAASKHALHGYFESLRAEVASRNIRVSLVVPGFIQTPIDLHALNGAGQPYGKIISANRNGMSSTACAEGIVQALEKNKQEALVGGLEMASVYLNRWFPHLFSKIIRNNPLHRLRHIL
jgi:dehydrogenase/reductase SDR family protein 7B